MDDLEQTITRLQEARKQLKRLRATIRKEFSKDRSKNANNRTMHVSQIAAE